MAVLGNLGGGFGEEPVRVRDLQRAAEAPQEKEQPEPRRPEPPPDRTIVSPRVHSD